MLTYMRKIKTTYTFRRYLRTAKSPEHRKDKAIFINVRRWQLRSTRVGNPIFSLFFEPLLKEMKETFTHGESSELFCYLMVKFGLRLSFFFFGHYL